MADKLVLQRLTWTKPMKRSGANECRIDDVPSWHATLLVPRWSDGGKKYLRLPCLDSEVVAFRMDHEIRSGMSTYVVYLMLLDTTTLSSRYHFYFFRREAEAPRLSVVCCLLGDDATDRARICAEIKLCNLSSGGDGRTDGRKQATTTTTM